MGIYDASENRVDFVYESGTWATDSGASQWIGHVQTHTINPNFNRTTDRYIGQGDRNISTFYDMVQEWGGTLNYRPQDWKFLGFALGSIYEATVGSTIHNIQEMNADQKSACLTSGIYNVPYSITIKEVQAHDLPAAPYSGLNFIRAVKGCCINSLIINGAEGDFVTVDVDYMGKDSVYASGNHLTGSWADASAATTRPYLWRDCKLYLSDGSPQSIVNGLKSFNFNINNNLERKNYMGTGSNTSTAIIYGPRDYALNFTADGTTEVSGLRAYYDKYFIGNSGCIATLEIIGDSTTGSERKMWLIMSGCKIVDMDNPSVKTGMNEVTVNVVPTNCSAVAVDTIGKYNLV